MPEIKLPYLELPNTPDAEYFLIPPNPIFDMPIADVPYLDPLLLPSLEQVKSGLGNDKTINESKKEETTKIDPATKELIPKNLPNTNDLKTEEAIATFNIPFVGEFPVPAPEVIASSVIASGVSATAAVTGSIILQSVINQLKKLMTKIFKKVLKKEIASQKKNDQN